jgi:hypothetical protein
MNQELILTCFPPDATFQIAIWSNVETALGITAGSLATLRPLLRVMMGSPSSHEYSSGFPGGQSPSASRQLGGPFPLGSMDESMQSRLRPDKLAVTVTTIKGQRRDPHDIYDDGSSSPSSSEERLTMDRSRPRVPGEMGLGIHRTFEVTQTSTDSHDVELRDVREHV